VGYAFVMSFCFACKRPFEFNPRLVPSIRHEGTKHPICRGCAERWMELHPDQPRLDLDLAYEPVAEEEL